MFAQSVYHTYKRYRTLQTSVISALPVVILMPHSACNCKCIMCDIWKGNRNLKQLTEGDLTILLEALRKFGTRQVVLSGGEALLHSNFFRLCEILKTEDIRITLLSTGLTLKHHAPEIVEWIDDLIVSIDGDEQTHDSIRNIPGAFRKTREGIEAIRALDSNYRVTGRSVIHRLNFKKWPAIIDAANELRLNQISFLPADVSSTAFNRETPWNTDRQADVQLTEAELPQLQLVIDHIIAEYGAFFDHGFIAESPEKIQKIATYYSALHGLNEFPYKKCNAPWVSAVIEADGNVKPCFFHPPIGNIRENRFDRIVNGENAVAFRKSLDIDQNETCKKCVCYLNLSPTAAL